MPLPAALAARLAKRGIVKEVKKPEPKQPGECIFKMLSAARLSWSANVAVEISLQSNMCTAMFIVMTLAITKLIA